MLGASAMAQDTEIITIMGVRDSISDSLGPATVVIGEEDLNKANGSSVLDYLKSVPGVFVKESISPGGQSSVYIRGSSQDQIIIAIDGTPISDPSLLGGGFDLSHTSVADLDSIEVYKGAQSVLFGSGGLGGVINLVTKKKKSESRIFTELGSQQHRRMGIHHGGQVRGLRYWINGEQLSAEGQSEANVKTGNAEDDGYLRQAVSTSLSYNTSQWYGTLSAKLSKTEKELDNFGDLGLFVDDINYLARGQNQSVSTSLGSRFFGMDWRLNLSRTEAERRYTDDVDAFHSTTNIATYHGDLKQASLTVLGDVFEVADFTIGLQGVEEAADIESQFVSLEPADWSRGMFLLLEQGFANGVSYKLSLRRDQFKRSGLENTGSMQMSYEVAEGQIYTSISRGFKAPSLYQSFDPNYGNLDLLAESSQTVELGYLLGVQGYKLNVAVFQNEFENLIDFDSKYVNREGLTSTRGLDMTATLGLGIHEVQLQLAYLDMSKNREPLLRRPQNKYRLQYSLQQGSLAGGLVYQWLGHTVDFDQSVLSAYETVSLFASYEVSKLKVYTRIENLLDREYYPLAGYSPVRRHGYVGLSYRI